MHRFPNSRLIPRKLTLSLRQLNARSGSRFHPKTHNDDNIRRREENQEAPLHLYKSKSQHILTNPRSYDIKSCCVRYLPPDYHWSLALVLMRPICYGLNLLFLFFLFFIKIILARKKWQNFKECNISLLDNLD